jgi:hypothetical protein
MREMLLTLGLPRAPHRRLLLRDPDQHHPPVTALGRGGGQQRPSDPFLALALAEVDHRNVVGFGPAMNLGHIGRADLPERGRGRDREPALTIEELAHPADRLQLRHVGLKEDPIHRAAGQRHVLAQ